MTIPYIILNKFNGDEAICKTILKEFNGTDVIRFPKNDTEIVGLDSIDGLNLSFDLKRLEG